ncbi:MAG: hypothetical protein AAF196_14400 [Planctomycetota bacterium]
MKTPTLAILTAAALVAAPAQAQSCGDTSIDPNVGSSVGSGDDTLLAGVNIGISFPFPGGMTTTTVDVDTNGRILFPDAGNGADFSESDTEFSGDSASICPYWDDLVSNDVSVRVDADKAVITFDVIPFGGSGNNLMQVTLFDTGAISIAWSSTMTFSSPIIGITSGFGATLPAPTDLTDTPFMSAGEPTVFESAGAGFTPDVAGFVLNFTPDGLGGYNTSSDCAVTSAFGAGCPTDNDPTSIYEFFDGTTNVADLTGTTTMFTPNGNGGYVAEECLGVGCFEPNVNLGDLSTEVLMLGDDAVELRTLPFMVTAPDGTTTSDIQIDSNGRVLLSSTPEASDFSPSVSELLGDEPSVNIAWSDLSPNVGGTVTLDVFSSPNRAVVTFLSVPFFGGVDSITGQCQLFEDGTILISTLDVNTADVTVCVGISGGNGAGGNNAIDLSDDRPFDSGSFVSAPTLTALSNPVLGGTIMGGNSFDLEFGNLPADVSTVFVLVGNEISTDLGALVPGLGLEGCTLLSDGSATTVGFPASAPSQTLQLELPNNPALIGFTSTWQAVAQAPSFGGVLGFGFTGAVNATAGL